MSGGLVLITLKSMKPLLLLCFLFSLGLAQDSVVYRGFAELRQNVNLPSGSWTWQPSPTLFDSLVLGSLNLSRVIEQSRQIQSPPDPPPLSAYEGKTVSFFWEGQWRTALVVDASQNLFLYDGRYLVGLPGVIGYPDRSGFQQNSGPRIMFRYQGAGEAKLSYLTRAISWSLSYTLEQGNLTGWANLSNNLDTQVNLGRAQLVAGTVPLLEGDVNPPPRPLPFQTEGKGGAAALPAEAQFAGEAGGTFRYQLPGTVVLPVGITQLPFIRTRVDPIYFWRYQGGFTTDNLNFQRGYRFIAPENLAGGVVSVRDQGVFVGQALVQDTGKGGTVRLSLGADPDGEAQRNTEQFGQDRFRVTTTYRNPRTYPIEVEVTEFFPQPFTLEFPEAQRTPEGYRLNFTLKPGETRVFSYVVTMPRQQ